MNFVNHVTRIFISTCEESPIKSLNLVIFWNKSVSCVVHWASAASVSSTTSAGLFTPSKSIVGLGSSINLSVFVYKRGSRCRDELLLSVGNFALIWRSGHKTVLCTNTEEKNSNSLKYLCIPAEITNGCCCCFFSHSTYQLLCFHRMIL